MKKIGILTYHRSMNYGAFMQAYSLSKMIKKNFPDCIVEIIDYTPKSLVCSYRGRLLDYVYLSFHAKTIRSKARMMLLLIQRIPRFLTHAKKSKLYDAFDVCYSALSLSEKKMITDNSRIVIDSICNSYDVLIVGSDAVWNWSTKRFPTAYFLNSKNKKAIKCSYAASAYGQPYLSCTEAEKDYISAALDDFSYLGVRDETTKRFVSFFSPSKECHHNCDPTVFLDLGGLKEKYYDKTLNLLLRYGVDLKTGHKPIIGIMGADWLGKIVRDAVGDDYQIVAIFRRNKFADCFLEELTPFEWAIVFSFFSITITHYFHGNLLSLKNKTPSIVVEEKNAYNQNYDSKIRDFMARIGLLEYCFWNEDIYPDSVRQTIDSAILNRNCIAERIENGLKSEEQFVLDFISYLREQLNILGEDNR